MPCIVTGSAALAFVAERLPVAHNIEIARGAGRVSTASAVLGDRCVKNGRQEGLHKPKSQLDVCDVLRALQKDLRGREEPPVFGILPCWQGSHDNVQSLTHWTSMKNDVRVV